MNNNEQQHWSLFIISHLMSVSWVWDALGMGGTHHLLFWCHVAASDMAPGFHTCPFVGAECYSELRGMVEAGGGVSRWLWWFSWVVAAVPVCGHSLEFILGCSLSFGQLLSFGWSWLCGWSSSLFGQLWQQGGCGWCWHWASCHGCCVQRRSVVVMVVGDVVVGEEEM